MFFTNKNAMNYLSSLLNPHVVDQRNRNRLQKVLSIFNNHVFFYPTTNSLSYFWGFGSLALLFLVVQLVTGIILVMHYNSDTVLAFESVVRLTNDVPYGWLFRYAHANGASFFLGIIYIHIGRGLYYGSFAAPRSWIWLTGVLIFLLVMGAGFIGYVLPWGQMSLWGATVITNLLSALPYGNYLAIWIWGGFSVSGVTLNRFFSLHYLLPFLVLATTFAHLYFLHDTSSSNPKGTDTFFDVFKSSFHTYFTWKDVAGVSFVLTIYTYLVFFDPNLLGHPDNYIKANPMVTPPHIVPEWYFLPFYAILRSIPHKLGGVLAMGLSLAMPAIYATFTFWRFWIVDCDIKRAVTSLPVSNFFFWTFVFNFFLLGVIGGKPVEYPFYEIGQLSTTYFFLFWVSYPIIFSIETYYYQYYTLNNNKV